MAQLAHSRFDAVGRRRGRLDHACQVTPSPRCDAAVGTLAPDARRRPVRACRRPAGQSPPSSPGRSHGHPPEPYTAVPMRRCSTATRPACRQVAETWSNPWRAFYGLRRHMAEIVRHVSAIGCDFLAKSLKYKGWRRHGGRFPPPIRHVSRHVPAVEVWFFWLSL